MHESMISVPLNPQLVSSSLQKVKAIAFANSKHFQSRTLKAGVPVIISFVDQNLESIHRICAATLWPSSVVPESQIAIDSAIRESGIPVGQTVNIKVCEELVHEASTIIFEPKFPDNSLNAQILEKLVVQQLVGRYIVKGMDLLLSVLGKPQSFQISEIHNVLSHCSIELGLVTQDTRAQIPVNKDQVSEKRVKQSTPELQIGGLESQLETVRLMAQLALHIPQLLINFGQKPPRGVLLYGPPGTGKTLLARKIASETQASIHVINGPDFVSSVVGHSEAQLRETFLRAQQESPSIVIIDEIDAICPRRDEHLGESEKRVVGSFLTLLDGISADSGIFVIGCTNRPNSIDKALRRPGRFDKEIEIGIPSEANRVKILEVQLCSLPHSLTALDIQFITTRAQGYVGADIAALVKESAIHALKRVLPSVHELSSRPGNEPDLTKVIVTLSDFEAALHLVKPSALREISAVVPSVTWNDIGGYAHIKQKLQEATELPLKHRDCFDRLGITPPRGLLLYGPPGCSKTLMAQAIANIQSLNFIPVKGSELLRKWVGESERAVKEIFQKAKAAAPAIIFFDEMDALASSRESETESSSVVERVVAQLLVEMSGIHSLAHVTVLGATNRPDLMDPALFGTNRFDRLLYVHPPTHEDRKQILSLHLKNIPNKLTDHDLDVVSCDELSARFSGADLKALVNEATLIAIKRELQATQSSPIVTFDDFQQAFHKVKPSINNEMIHFYQRWSEHQSKALHV